MASAKSHTEAVNPESMFKSRLEFLKCIMAIKVAHQDVLHRSVKHGKKGETKSKTIQDILDKALTPKYL